MSVLLAILLREFIVRGNLDSNMRYNYDIARQARTVRHIQPMLTTHHAYFSDVLKNGLSTMEAQTPEQLIDEDGVRQFVLGVDSLDDADVRIGFA